MAGCAGPVLDHDGDGWVQLAEFLREQARYDIADARRMKDEAEAQAAQAAAETAQARASAQRLAQDARTKAQAEVSARLAEEEAKLAEQAAVAEARISKARDAAMANVASIASDTAGLIVSKLTGRAATTAELTAAKGA